jgi:hypothetical protein
LWDGERGCYVPQGTPSLQQMQYQQQGYGQQQGYNQQQQQYIQQVGPQIVQQLLSQGRQQGVPFQQVINGQNMRCSWQDAVGTAVKDAAIANVFAYAVNRIAKRDRDVVDRRGATAVGALAGATIFCEPDMVNENVQQQGYQQVQQYQPQIQQQVQYQPQMQQQSQNAQQIRRAQQGGVGCQNATVDGETGCYNPQYLQTLIRH